MRRTTLAPMAALALAALALTACSGSDSAGTESSDASTEAATTDEEFAPAEFETWLAELVAAEADFYATADGQALHVISEVTDTQQGAATADSVYNADDTFVATSMTTGPDGTSSTMRVGCTVETCFRSEDDGPWEEVDRALVARPAPGSIATALQDFESAGTVTYSQSDTTYRATVEIPEAEGQPAGTAELDQVFGDAEMTSRLVVTIGEDTTTTTSAMSIGETAALPDDLP